MCGLQVLLLRGRETWCAMRARLAASRHGSSTSSSRSSSMTATGEQSGSHSQQGYSKAQSALPAARCSGSIAATVGRDMLWMRCNMAAAEGCNNITAN